MTQTSPNSFDFSQKGRHPAFFLTNMLQKCQNHNTHGVTEIFANYR